MQDSKCVGGTSPAVVSMMFTDTLVV